MSSLLAEVEELKAADARHQTTIKDFRSYIKDLLRSDDYSVSAQDPDPEISSSPAIMSEDLTINATEQDLIDSPTSFFTLAMSSADLLSVGFTDGPASPSAGRSVVTGAVQSIPTSEDPQVLWSDLTDFEFFSRMPQHYTAHPENAWSSRSIQDFDLVGDQVADDRHGNSAAQPLSSDPSLDSPLTSSLSPTQRDHTIVGEASDLNQRNSLANAEQPQCIGAMLAESTGGRPSFTLEKIEAKRGIRTEASTQSLE